MCLHGYFSKKSGEVNDGVHYEVKPALDTYVVIRPSFRIFVRVGRRQRSCIRRAGEGAKAPPPKRNPGYNK